MELDVLHIVTTLLDHVMKNHMRKREVPNTLVTKAKTKLKTLIHLIGSRKVLANLDHKKVDAPAPPQKNHCIDDLTSMYDEFEDELEKIHHNGVEILVVNNLDARIELEFSIYEIYKVTNLEKK